MNVSVVVFPENAFHYSLLASVRPFFRWNVTSLYYSRLTVGNKATLINNVGRYAVSDRLTVAVFTFLYQ
jgi:hypothetical protein